MQIHNRISLLRADRGLSRKALADALSINYQTVGYLERGDYNPSLELALKLAAFFDLPVEAMFSLEPFAPLSDQMRPNSTANGTSPHEKQGDPR